MVKPVGLMLLPIALILGCERQPEASPPQAPPSSATNPASDRPDNPGSKIKPEDAKLSGDLGTRTNPVRCDFPDGERAYLSRLRCGSGGIGSGTQFNREGSTGPGPYGNLLDHYTVRCGGKTFDVYMDMYHPGYVENRPVPGFTITK